MSDSVSDPNIITYDLYTIPNSYPKNLAIGQNNLRIVNTDASNNICVGSNSLYSLTSGSGNSTLGYNSMYSSLTTSNNTSVGYNSGVNCVNGSNNTFLGAQTGFNSSSNILNNSTSIGYGAAIDSSYQIILGTNTTNVYIPGNLGIKNSSANYVFDLSGNSHFYKNYILYGNSLSITEKNASDAFTITGDLFISNDLSLNPNVYFNGDIDISGNVNILSGNLNNYPNGILYNTSFDLSTLTTPLPNMYQIDISFTSTSTTYATITLPYALNTNRGQVITFYNWSTIYNRISTKGSDLLYGIGIITGQTSLIFGANNSTAILQCGGLRRWIILWYSTT